MVAMLLENFCIFLFEGIGYIVRQDRIHTIEAINVIEQFYIAYPNVTQVTPNDIFVPKKSGR
jgi:hypothetical protein